MYECRYLLLVPTLSLFSYYSCLFLRGGPDDIRRVIKVATSEVLVLVSVQFLLDAADRAAPDYFFRSLRF